MTRTRASARAAGSSFERLIADHLRDHVDDRIDRRVKTGAKDRGDIGGVRILLGGRMVLECKDTTRTSLGSWQAEVDTERGNDDAVAGAIVHKRHGKGAAGKQWVTMEVDDLVALLTGERPPP
jgi:hypothetical protein